MLSHRLVCIFLRGGADGLSLVPPVGDPRYRTLRPGLALPSPDDATVSPSERALDLDGFFALHPALAPLMPAYRAGELAIVHAVGSDDDTRSHFEAQDRMERGGATRGAVGSGWLSRLLRMRSGPLSSLAAVAVGHQPPEALRGAPSVAVFESAASHRLAVDRDRGYVAALRGLYAHDGALEDAGREALSASRRLREMGAPATDASYPDDPFGRRLAELARILAADVGVEVACVDLDGWDTHFVQGPDLAVRARVLAEGLAAFRGDLGSDIERTTIMVMTEFGRRAYENGSLGTDHGRGSVFFALGAGVSGGRVHGDFPGLAASALEGPGDLRVTTDYRHLLAEWVRNVAGVGETDVFPGLARRDLGVFG